MAFNPLYSTDDVYYGQNTAKALTPELDTMKRNIASLMPASNSPLEVASMHLGRLDNNSGGEFASTNRICSEAIVIESGKSYWQVNDKGVNMYVLLYDADEMFVQYFGNIPSGQKMNITAPTAKLMRLSSLVGEYDLTNVFKIFDTDPTIIPSGGEGYNKAESDARFAAIAHTHTDLHTHGNKPVLDSITAEKMAAWDAGTGSGGGGTTPVDAYTKSQSDAKFALKGEVGVKGDKGDQGVQGIQGIQGVQGERGLQGERGYTGTSGSQGLKGDKGDTGATGATGATGSQGPRGYAGIDGRDGAEWNGILSTSYNVVKVGGQQMLYNSGSATTLATNNQATNIAGSSISASKPISTGSDERLKNNISDVNTEALCNVIDNVKIKTFHYKDRPDTKLNLGCIAQQLKSISGNADYFVEENEEGYLTVSGHAVLFALIAKVQDLQTQINELSV